VSAAIRLRTSSLNGSPVGVGSSTVNDPSAYAIRPARASSTSTAAAMPRSRLIRGMVALPVVSS
jgi:hypothetical protein